MSACLNSITVDNVRQSPFFVISGPIGRYLSCQWASFSNDSAQRSEFEIVCPETPEAMGCLFGIFEDGTFRFRPAVKQLGHSWFPAPDLDLDLTWRGTIADVIATGSDWDIDQSGSLYIPEQFDPSLSSALDLCA